MTLDITQLVNTDIYPLHLPGDDEKYKTVVTEHRSKFCMDGLVAFPNFFRAELLPQVVKEISERDSETIKTSAYHTIYVDEGDEAYPENHVRNRKYHTKVQTLPYNKIPEQNALRQLYNNDMFVEFVRKVFNLPSLFRSADPAGACTVNVFKEGCYNAWHFDQSQFSTSIMLQAPEAGGEFQYTMPFRNWMSTQRRVSEGFEKVELEDATYFDLVEKVIGTGDDLETLPDRAKRFPFGPGTLCLFQGCRSLHRVSRCQGSRDRLVAILCFYTRPNARAIGCVGAASSSYRP